MCGVFGHFSSSQENTLSKDILEKMGDAIAHRGPDGQGIYFEGLVSLGNQRLAIIDLDNGNQPFISDDGSVVVVQNGEIFNHVELAEELKFTKHECRTHSDTEVILRLYEKEGIDFVNKLNGMFAIAIYDKEKNKMFIIRDRVGEKPLYYSNDKNLFVFASEIKSMREAIKLDNVCYQAIDSYITLNYIPSPLTIFDGVFQLEPGHYLEVDTFEGQIRTRKNKWWDLSKIEVLHTDEEEIVRKFNEILYDAVRIRTRSDVPFGAFLSGGVDSSSVVGIMSKILPDPVKTFCIGFNETEYDESPFALLASKRFGTEHIAEKVDADMLSGWEEAVYYSDQPHGDVSFLPTRKVARLASEHVKMVLTGDGADELFAGYSKYTDLFSRLDRNDLDKELIDSCLESISLFSEEEKNKLYKEDVFEKIDRNYVNNTLTELISNVQHQDKVNQFLYVDTMTLLHGNNLVKPDRMGMAESIENRSPFLDHRMVELAFSIPGSLKFKDGETKYIYKKAVSNLIGDDLAYRKKQMFTVPIGEWFKTTYKDYIYTLLLNEHSFTSKIFNKDYIFEMLECHVTNKVNYTRQIRALISLELWFSKVLSKEYV